MVLISEVNAFMICAYTNVCQFRPQQDNTYFDLKCCQRVIFYLFTHFASLQLKFDSQTQFHFSLRIPCDSLFLLDVVQTTKSTATKTTATVTATATAATAKNDDFFLFATGSILIRYVSLSLLEFLLAIQFTKRFLIRNFTSWNFYEAATCGSEPKTNQ